MNTQNVKTAAPESSERWEAKNIFVEVRAKQIFESGFIAALTQQICFVKNAE